MGDGVVAQFQALLGIGGPTGEVYPDYELGGPIDVTHYLKTTPAEDKEIKALLADLIGEKGAYQAWGGPSCRTFSQDNWWALAAMGYGRYGAPPPLTHPRWR